MLADFGIIKIPGVSNEAFQEELADFVRTVRGRLERVEPSRDRPGTFRLYVPVSDVPEGVLPLDFLATWEERFIAAVERFKTFTLTSAGFHKADFPGGGEFSSGASFSLYLDPGQASPETVAEVLAALNAVHRAAGGEGLRFTVEGLLLGVTAEASQ